MRFSKHFIFPFLLLGFIKPVDAEDGVAKPLEPMLVTANRHSSSVDRIAGNVTLINRKDIENSTATNLPELLASTGSIAVSQLGGAGGQTSFFMRGTDSNHTAILINGHQQKSSLGSIQLQYLDLNQVERIEIIRGPQSSAYGSDAIGGVINIITKRTDTGLVLNLENATHNSQSQRASMTDENYSLSVSRKSSESFDYRHGDTQNDNDAYTLEGASLSINYTFNETAQSEILFNGQQGKSKYDNVLFDFDPVTFALSQIPSTNPATEFKNHTIAINNEFQIEKSWLLEFNLAQASNESREFDNPYALPGNFNQFTHDSISIISRNLLSKTLTSHIGLEQSKDTWEKETSFKQSLDNTATFAFIEHATNRYISSLSLRLDDNEQYGTHSSYRASYQFIVNKNLSTYISTGTGFKAPDFDEIFSIYYLPGSSEKLEPETSISQELGLKSETSVGNITLAIFQTDIEDYIVYEGFLAPKNINGIDYWGQLSNIEEVEIEGIELIYSLEFDEINFTANAQYNRAFNLTNDTELLRRPRRIANMAVDYRPEQWFQNKLLLSLHAHGESTRFDIDDNGVIHQLPGYGIVNAQAKYHTNESTEIYLKAGNIFDKRYQTIIDYQTEGESFTLGINSRL